MDTTEKIKKAGLKVTPQRLAVYEAMTKLRHATIDDIIAEVQSHNNAITVSTIYRVLDSFYKAHLLSLVCRADTGKCYYDITVSEHHHIFDGDKVIDYNDSELTDIIRKYLHEKKIAPDSKLNSIQVQVILNNHLLIS